MQQPQQGLFLSGGRGNAVVQSLTQPLSNKTCDWWRRSHFKSVTTTVWGFFTRGRNQLNPVSGTDAVWVSGAETQWDQVSEAETQSDQVGSNNSTPVTVAATTENDYCAADHAIKLEWSTRHTHIIREGGVPACQSLKKTAKAVAARPRAKQGQGGFGW